MEKLHWEFESHGGTYGAGYQRAEYRGLIIEAHVESSPMNPFEDWDCEPPTAVFTGGRNGGEHDYSGGDIFRPLDHLTDGRLRLRRYWEAIARELDICPNSLRNECVEEARDYGGRFVDAMREKLEEALGDLAPGYYSGNASDYCEALASLWNLAGIEALAWGSSGYSQGDYANGISVALPSWAEKCGAPRESHKRQLEAAGDLWGAWAWGDVYGFIAKDPQGEDLESEALDSCWGYYGSDHGDSGLEESAIEAADSIIESAKRARIEALRTAARNRVPLQKRAAMLVQAAGDLAPLFA